MRYAVICTDKANHLETRTSNRDAHVAYLKSTKVEMAGPFLDAAGDMCGSLVIVEAESRAEVEAWAANDPYALAGLFQDVRIEAWKKVIG